MNGEKVKLYGPDGRPIKRRSLTSERARPTWTGLRRVWRYETIASGLTPERLGTILRDADQGDPRDFLTLAEEMEERDLHYGSVLATRKRAVSRLKPVVESASDDAKDLELADAVRELVSRPQFRGMVGDALDALGKGYSLVEIIWGRGERWEPERYEWRDPRWFVPDRDDGRTLRLYDDEDPVYGVPLDPYKWIRFIPTIKSGLPIRGGLARLAAIAYLCKSFSMTDWVRYSEIFGQPFRVGKYGPDATEEDIGRLIAALANLGSDAAAAIPESMMIEFMADKGSGSGGMTHEKLCFYLDKQVSKGVLGQTMTTDDGSSKSQAQVHDDVRQEVTESDSGQLASHLQRDLVEPYVQLNFGPQPSYPQLTLPLPDTSNIEVLSSALAELVPLGLRVGASVVRDRLGLPDPADDDELLTPSSSPAGPPRAANRALNREDPLSDTLDEIEAEGLRDWEQQADPILEPIRNLAAASNSYQEFQAGLPGLLEQMDSGELVRRLALAAFKARGMGDASDRG